MHAFLQPDKLLSTSACRIFTLLQWRLGTLLLGGTAAHSAVCRPSFQPFTQLGPSARDSFMQGWAKSRIALLLQVFTLPRRMIESLCCSDHGDLPLHSRRYVAHLWLTGNCAMQAFKGMKSLLMSTVFSYTNSKGQNMFWPGIQYAGEACSLCAQASAADSL